MDGRVSLAGVDDLVLDNPLSCLVNELSCLNNPLSCLDDPLSLLNNDPADIVRAGSLPTARAGSLPTTRAGSLPTTNEFCFRKPRRVDRTLPPAGPLSLSPSMSMSESSPVARLRLFAVAFACCFVLPAFVVPPSCCAATPDDNCSYAPVDDCSYAPDDCSYAPADRPFAVP